MMVAMHKHCPKMANEKFASYISQKGLSQRALGDLMGQSAASINLKLQGKVAWQQRDLVRLNELFGITSDFVLGIDKESN